MKRFTYTLLLLFVFSQAFSQNIPKEWSKYLTDEYVVETRDQIKEKKESEHDFLQSLKQYTIKGLASQIEVKIENTSSLRQEDVDGEASEHFVSNTSFSTDVELNLVQTKVKYDKKRKQGYAIAFIHKLSACDLYHKQSINALGTIESTLHHAKNLSKQGGKKEAKEEVLSVLGKVKKLNGSIDKLIVFGCLEGQIDILIERRNKIIIEIKEILAEAKNEVASIYFDSSELFLDSQDHQIETTVKNHLTKNKCIFVDYTTKADWIIKIDSEIKVRELNEYHVYFCDAICQLKIIRAQTGLTIYDEEIREKGGSTRSFERAAKDASNTAGERIAKTITKKIFSEEFVFIKDGE